MNCESCGHENLDGARFCASCGIPLVQQSEGSWIGRLVGGRFRVTSVLGEGGMGVVYAAEQQMGSTVRRAAIKTLHPHLSKDASVLARFHRECGTVAQLEHPNTIKVFDFGSEDDGTLYIAMEFVEGEGLDRLIDREGPLAPARVVDILEQVCGALDEAHDQGIVHRDLKPENVVLGEKLGRRDFVKVLDFGIAARRESADAQREQKLTQQGMVLGTPPYMSPEQFTGVELDRRSDIYSLGVMAYEMLTGTLPFSASTPWQWATEHMTAQPKPMEQRPSGIGVPPSMRDAVMRALAKAPEERPATAGEFVRTLRAGLTARAASEFAQTEAMQAMPVVQAVNRGAAAVDGGGATGAMPQRSGASTRADGSHLASAAAAAAGTQTDLAATSLALPRKKPSGLVFGLVGLLALGGVVGAVALGGGANEPATPAEPDSSPTAANLGDHQGPAASPAPAPLAPGGGGKVSDPAPAPPPPHGGEPKSPAGQTSPPSPPEIPSPATQPKPGTAPSTAPKPVPAPAPAPASAGTPTPAAAKAAECGNCASLVRSGAWSRAAAIYGSCPVGDQKQCNAAARQEIRKQLDAALTAGHCSQARSIASSSKALGVTAPVALQRRVDSCK